MKATAPFGIFIDGERERMPYEGDAYINQLGWFCCCSSPDLPRNTLKHLTKQHTWPFEWFLLMPLMFRDYLLYTGDTQTVQECLPLLEPCLLRDFWNADGLLHAPDTGIRALIDWPEEERDNYDMADVNLVPNCFLYGALLAMEELTGNHEYGKNASGVRETIRRQMLVNGSFVDSPGSTHTALHSLMFPLFFGVGAKEECTGIESRGMACSVYAAQFLVEACFRYGMDAHAFSLMTSKDIRSWYNMIAKGATISMEAWDNCFKPNQDWNHAWGAAPANLIPRFIGGIRPITPGFKSFEFDPHPCSLDNFSLKHPTCNGDIAVDYDGRKFSLLIPDGTTAIFKGKSYSSGKVTLEL